MERIADFAPIMAKAAIALRYAAADQAGRAHGLLHLAGLLERVAETPDEPKLADRGLLEFVDQMILGGRDMLQRS
jgi:hypothetical protein